MTAIITTMRTTAQLVDENDKEISVKDGDTLSSDDIFRVSLLWIVNDKQQVLLAQRAFSKTKDPGVWGSSAAGTVEEGETYQTNIVKEAQEELGLHINNLESGPKLQVRGKFNYFCQHFIYRADVDLDSIILQTSEVADVKWFEIEVLGPQISDRPADFGYKLVTYSR
jgi:isopentenyldiphosphate isomerase